MKKKKIWYQNNPQLLNNLKEQLRSKYPSLHIILDKETVSIKGNFPIYDVTNQKVIDEFKIEIEIPGNFPETIPTVKETGGKIPLIADRHFYTNGVACLFMPEERYKYMPEGSTIINFIQGPVKSFFVGQIGFAQTGQWIFGQHAHNEIGVIEYYKQLLKTDDIRIIPKFLFYLSKRRVRGRFPCYCGSKIRMSHCHFKTLLKVRQKIKPSDVQRSYNLIKKYL